MGGVAKSAARKSAAKSSAGANPFGGLDELIAALNPQHARTKRAPALEPDAPARLRQLWESIGVSRASDALPVPLLSRAESEKQMAELFAKWDASPKDRGVWGGGADSFRKALPKQVRLVDKRRDEILVTNESEADPDPRVLCLRQYRRPVLRLGCRYSEWLIWTLLGSLTVTRRAEYNRLAKAEKKRLLAKAYPTGLYQVGDGIWTMRFPAIPQVIEDPNEWIFYASMDAYLELVLASPEKKLPLFRPPAGNRLWVKSSGPLDLSKGVPAGFRASRAVGYNGKPENWLQAIGRVGKTIVWLGMSPISNELLVTYNPRAQAAVEKWVRGIGLGIKRKRALVQWSREGDKSYDLFGW